MFKLTKIIIIMIKKFLRNGHSSKDEIIYWVGQEFCFQIKIFLFWLGILIYNNNKNVFCDEIEK